MKRRSFLPNGPKIAVCICFGAFWICNKVLSYGRLTINFRLVVFTYTRWLFSYGIAIHPDARGDMFYSVCYAETTNRRNQCTERTFHPDSCKLYFFKIGLGFMILWTIQNGMCLLSTKWNKWHKVSDFKFTVF